MKHSELERHPLPPFARTILPGDRVCCLSGSAASDECGSPGREIIGRIRVLASPEMPPVMPVCNAPRGNAPTPQPRAAQKSISSA
jgi:hypothetical protein